MAGTGASAATSQWLLPVEVRRRPLRKAECRQPTRIRRRKAQRRIVMRRRGWALADVRSGGDERRSQGGAMERLRTGGGVDGGRNRDGAGRWQRLRGWGACLDNSWRSRALVLCRKYTGYPTLFWAAHFFTKIGNKGSCWRGFLPSPRLFPCLLLRSRLKISACSVEFQQSIVPRLRQDAMDFYLFNRIQAKCCPEAKTGMPWRNEPEPATTQLETGRRRRID